MAVLGIAQRLSHDHVGCSSVVFRHKKRSTLCTSATHSQLVSNVNDPHVAEKAGGIKGMDARQRHLCNAGDFRL